MPTPLNPSITNPLMELDRNSLVLGLGIGGVVGAIGGLYFLRSSNYNQVSPIKDHLNERRSLKLYHSFPFRSSRCAWLINELGIQDIVEVIPVSLHGPGAQDLPKYKSEVHPHGTIPALQLEDGSVMLESSGICLYLADTFSSVNGLLPPADRTRDYYDKISYATSTFDQVLEPLYMQLTHTPEESRDQKLIDTQLNNFKIIAQVLSNHFQKNEYVCGGHFTAADCVLGYNIWWASVIKKGTFLQEYPVLIQYLERLKKRPAFEMTFVGKRPIKPSGGSL